MSEQHLKLIGLHGPYKGKSFDVVEGVVTMGRGADNGIVLCEDTVCSRLHCQLVLQNGRLIVEDMGSTNGVTVNNEDVINSAVLQPDDHLGIGKSVFQVTDISAQTSPKQETNIDLDAALGENYDSTVTAKLSTYQSKQLKNSFKLFFKKK